MPRIINSDSEPLDFCEDCFPYENEAEDLYQYKVSDDDNDGRGDCFGYDEDHPEYDECEYQCELCRKELTNEDN